jgi:hypothetical protein
LRKIGLRRHAGFARDGEARNDAQTCGILRRYRRAHEDSYRKRQHPAKKFHDNLT